MAINDWTLLERWIAIRDAEAFKELVTRYSGLVYATCRRVLRNQADAEDIAQECFLELARSPAAPRRSLAGWLHRLATHRSLDHQKAQSRRRRREEVFAKRVLPQEEPPWKELQGHVDEAILALPEKLRLVIVAHFLEQEPQHAIAGRLGIAHQTVSHRIARGIDHLRKDLARRGVIATPSLLGALFASEATACVPASLMAALGKVSLAGTAGSPGAAASLARAPGAASRLAAAGTLAAVSLVALGFLFGPWSPWAGRPAERRLAAGGETGLQPEEAAPAEPKVPAGPDTGGLAAEAARDAVRGRVVDAAGNPVPGARVAAGTKSRGKLAEEKADGAGSFRLGLPEPGPFTVCAFQAGVGLVVRPEIHDGESAVELRLEPLGAVGGLIYDQATGEGIDGAHLELSLLHPLDPPLSAAPWFDLAASWKTPVSYRGGRYLFADLPRGKYLFLPAPHSSDYALPGYHGLPPVHVIVASGEQKTGVDFILKRGGAIAGTVFDPRGQPLPGSQVHIVSSGHSVLRLEARKSGGDGTYRFTGLPVDESYAVVVDHEGLAQSHSITIALPGAEEHAGLDIHMVRGNSIHGRLVDEEGNGVAGARFWLGKRFWNSMDHFGREEVVCREDGSFTIDRVGPGEYGFVPRAPGFEEVLVLQLTMPADRDLRDQVFVLKRLAAGFVSGRVTDGEGRPLAGIRLVAISVAAGPLVSGEAHTGGDGSYRFDGLGKTNRLRIEVYPDRFARETRIVPINSAGVDFQLSRFASAGGRVVDDQTGEPVKEFTVRDISFRIREEGLAGDWKTIHAEDGGFLLEEIEPPAVRIEVRAEGYAPSSTERASIRARERLDAGEVRLRRGAWISGRVFDAATGQGLVGAKVRAHEGHFHSTLLSDRKEAAEGTFEALAMADAEGRFRIDGVDPGKELGLVAWHPGYGTEVIARVSAPAEPTLRLHREGKLRVEVREGARPMDGIQVVAFRREAGTPLQPGYWTSAWTQVDGAAELAGLPPGHFKVVLGTKDRRQLGILEAEVPSGETTTLNVETEALGTRSATVSGTVQGADPEAACVVALVSVVDPMDLYGRAVCDGDGGFRLEGVPAGDYLLIARQQEPAREADVKIAVEEGGSHQVSVEIK
jgi:RNA polymerase sigma-70 factor (ECF subfamily)